MAAKRRYDEACAAAHALDLIGERWALLVVRELLLGPKRFTDLRASLPSLSANVLTQRLGELEACGLVRRRTLPPPGAARVYELTDWGLELESVIQALGRWGARSPLRPQQARMSVDSLILSFRTTFDAGAAGDFAARIELQIDGSQFQAGVAHGRLELTRGSASRPDAVIAADVNTLAGVTYGGHKFSEVLESGALHVEGNRSAAERFFRLFPLPEPA